MPRNETPPTVPRPSEARDAPWIGLTLGDPAGVGPELARAALESLPEVRPLRLYGPAPLVEAIARVAGRCDPCPTTDSLEGIRPGCYSPASGRAALAALDRAARDLAAGAIGALVTGPLDKRAFRDAGDASPGQTEFVARACGVRRFAMLLAGPRLRVALVTRHLALREVPDAITAEAIVETTRLTADHLRRFEGIDRPRVAVLGVNPHASDEGRFGNEEARVLVPALDLLRADDLALEGPLPADTAFHRAWEGDFDAVVAMYHDQGLGPLKLVHFREAVNVTLGLPRLRVSPDHGPAFDRAGRGTADPGSLREALRLAARSASRSPGLSGS
ncbi:MAG TPA: 4-hydroxythreonine-4-phosphate dehydrogenase PdxA [Myxococcota bacterium]|nr:4-hydroxythreonine-4-phosphate dehydrogenase PdxA [Myxococcota bacterium]HQK51922.1 4-hydroxythreonine-4-phosphate dehydrogenase PdxA [Myxococcota bacterium]